MAFGSLLLLVIGFAGIGNAVGATNKLVCYYGSWAVYRPGIGSLSVESIDPHLCTHIIYGFVGIQSTGEIRIMDTWNDVDLNAFGRFSGLKSKNPNLKAIVAIGGWNEGSTTFSSVAANAGTRATLIKSAVQFLTKYNYDGFDLDWEYPAQRGGSSSDVDNFTTLLKEMRTEFDKHGFLLSAAVAATKTSSSTSYNIAEIQKYLDFINVMTYDLHGTWENNVGGNSPLVAGSWENSDNQRELNVDACIQNWISMGAPASKLVLGIGLYGHVWTLADPSNTQVGAPATGPGTPGPYTQQAGYLGYNEICGNLLGGGWTTVMQPEQKFPYSYKGNQWVGYDNSESIKYKIAYAKANGLGGAMVWSLETDDFSGLCGSKWPLMSTIKSEMGLEGVTPGNTTSTTTSSTSTTTTDTPTTAVSPSTTTTSTSSSTTTTTNPGTIEPEYPNSLCSSAGYIRDPRDCSVFYYCMLVHGNYQALKYQCPSGTVYNAAITVCDYPYNVAGCH